MSSEQSIEFTDYSSTDLSNYKLSNPKSGAAKKGKSGNLYYNGKRLYIKTPLMHAPFGANIYQDSNKPESQQSTSGYTVSCSLDNSNKLITTFHEYLCALDKFVVDSLKKDSALADEWIGKPKSNVPQATYIELTYKPMVRVNENKVSGTKHAPLLSLKLKLTDGNQDNSEIYNEKCAKEEVSLDKNSPNYICKVVKAHCHVSCLITPSVWQTTSGMGVTWYIVQLKYKNSPQIPKNICLIDNDPSETVNDPTSDNEEEDDVEEDEEETQEKK